VRIAVRDVAAHRLETGGDALAAEFAGEGHELDRRHAEHTEMLDSELVHRRTSALIVPDR